MAVGDKVFLRYLAWVFIPAVMAGFFAMSVGQSVVETLYQPLAQFGFDGWLRSLGNLQAAYDYLSERDNLARWNRIVVYYALIVPLLPLSWLAGVRFYLHSIKHPKAPFNKEKIRLKGVWLILVYCAFFTLFLHGMVKWFVPDFFTVTLNAEHLPTVTHSTRSFLGWQIGQNSIYASDLGFFHAPVGFVFQTIVVLLLLGSSRLVLMQALPAQFGDFFSPISGYFKKLSALIIIMATGFFYFALLLRLVGVERYSPCFYTNPSQHHSAPTLAALMTVIVLLIDLVNNKVLTLKSLCLAALCPALWFVVYVMMFLKTPGCTL